MLGSVMTAAQFWAAVFFMEKRLKFHPAAQIVTWCVLVAALQVMAPGTLLIAAGSALVCAYAMSRLKFIQLVRSTRWVMLSLFAIYAYSTPGQPLVEALGMASPSREGLSDGLVQLARLLVALAGLAILLERLHRQQLIAGLYTLFLPLQWLGISRERIAVRLALTLHYAEVAVLRGASNWQDALNGLIERPGVANGTTNGFAVGVHQPGPAAGSVGRKMELPLSRFGVLDALLLSGAVLVLWLVLR